MRELFDPRQQRLDPALKLGIGAYRLLALRITAAARDQQDAQRRQGQPATAALMSQGSNSAHASGS